MIAIQIETKVGRCESCHRFRNNMEWKVGEKVVCIDCFRTLKNQRLINEVIKRVPKVDLEQNRTGKKVKKVKEEKPKREINNYKEIVLNYLKNTDKPLSVREMYEAKVASKVTLERWLKVLIGNGEVISMRSTARAYYIDKDREHLLKDYIQSLCCQKRIKLKDVVLKIIKSSPAPLTPLEINQKQSWHNKSVYPVLKKLLEENKIVYRKISEIVRLYIDVDRANLLDGNSRCFENGELGETKKKILDFIYESSKILSIKDITKGLEIHRSTSLRLCRELERQGLIVMDKGANRNEATLVSPANNERLLIELKSRAYNTTVNKLKRFMELGNAVTLREIYKAVGCGRGRSSTRKYVQKLLIQWGCKLIEEDGIVKYALEIQKDNS